MSKNYKKITFTLPEFIIKHLEEHLKMIGYQELDVSYLLKCCAINRLIDKGILNEFGEPFSITLGSSIDFGKIENPFNISGVENNELSK